jgi:integrase
MTETEYALQGFEGLGEEDSELFDSFLKIRPAGSRSCFSSFDGPGFLAPQARRIPSYPTAPTSNDDGILLDFRAYISAPVSLFHMKRFHSVSEMVNAGYCLDHFKHLQPIPPGARIGLPDDDIPLQPDECRRMEESTENLRDRILLGMMFRTGARIAQVLGIRVKDLDFVQGRVFVQRRKEGISFYRYLDPPFLQLVCHYVRHYRLSGDDFLFCVKFIPKSRGKWVKEAQPFRRHEAGDVVRYYAEKVGIQYRYVSARGELRWRIHCHTSKYTYCSIGYDESHDILAVALSVGNTTTYPLEKAYIKVPVSRRHAIAFRVIERITGRRPARREFDPARAYAEEEVESR